MRKSRSDSRTFEDIKRHYQIEKELAHKLRIASKEERKHLYPSLYDEFYKLVPDHSQALREKANPQKRAKRVNRQIRFLKRFINPNVSFLEIGAGDCVVSFEVAKLVNKVYALDVSAESIDELDPPENFELIISDGFQVPVPQDSIDVVYSNQLMEHLHPDDAMEQLQNIFRCIAVGGIYICSTPNRLSGPHDVSRYFDKVATGFHLKEYSFIELNELFKQVGFSKTHVYCGGRKQYVKLPKILIKIYEIGLEIIPHIVRRKLLRIFPFKSMLGSTIAGVK